MLCFPNAKINLGLFVTEKRSDGYHNLETVFYPVRTSDALEILPAAQEEGQLHMSGLEVSGSKEDNLVWKAWHMLHHDFPEQVAAYDIYLHKVIPMGAGLGGGSADAAAMLRLINEYGALSLTDEALAAYALRLGSDCPFFIYNRPLFASGRGDLFTPVSVDLADYRLILVCPPVHVATAAAFRDIQAKPPVFDLRTLGSLPVAAWKDHMHNDFEAPVFAQFPQLSAIKTLLYEAGAIYAAMSGSGSALYGIFDKDAKPVLEGNFKVMEG